MSILPPKLSRYASVASLLRKYGRKAVAHGDAGAVVVEAAVDDEAPEQLARDLEKLGPTFIKLGQVLASRPDLLLPAYRDALARLQDNVEPFPFPDVQRIVEEELKVRLSKAFSAFDEKPLAAASLGQVHRAALRDGMVVAVKVQRPDVAAQVARDLEALDEVALFLDKHTETGHQYDVIGMVAEFREAITAELDYNREANNLRVIAGNLAEFEEIFVPQPIQGYTTTRVLTMEFVFGTKVTSLTPIARLDIDGATLGESLIRAYLKQILIDGIFHADPHPGNVFVTDTGLLALLDLGMIGRVAPTMQEQLFKLLLAVSEGRGDEAAEAAVAMGEKMPAFDEPGFKRRIAALAGRYGHESLADFQIGRVFIDLTRVAYEHHMRPPSELTMLGKTLLHLDEVARALDPRLDVNEAIRRNSAELMGRRVRKAATAGGMFAAVLEAKDFATKLPRRVSRVLDALAASELKMQVELIDEGAIIGGLQKVANRITLGLILASLIIGAAMLMRIDTPFRIFGYPGFAMILFLLAATGAMYLAAQIMLNDRSPKRR